MILLLPVVLSQLDKTNLLYSIRQIPIEIVAIVIGLQIVSQLLVNYQWYKIAKLTNLFIPFHRMLYINCLGSVVDSITPGVKVGGEITRTIQISRIGKCSVEQSGTIPVLQKIFSLSAFFFIQLFAVGFLIRTVSLFESEHIQISIYSVLLLFLLIFATIFFIPHRIKSYLSTKKSPRFFHSLLEQVVVIRKNTKAWVPLLLLSFLIWLIYPFKLYILAIQIFNNVPIIYIVAITFVSYMVAMLPIFPGGLGGFEGTMVGLFTAVGLPISCAAVITLLFRFITFWLVMLLSIIFIAFYKIYYKLCKGGLSHDQGQIN